MRRTASALVVIASGAWAAAALAQPAPAPSTPAPSAPPPSAPAAPSTPPDAPASPAPAPSGTTAVPEAAPSAAPAPEPPPAEPATPAPAPPPPVAEPKPTEVAPATKAAAAPAAAPATRDEPAPAGPNPWQDGHALGVEALVRVGGRLGPSSYATTSEERGGLGFRLSGLFSIASSYAVGFGLVRSGLGSLTVTNGANSGTADYAATAIELAARAFPFRQSGVELYLGLHAGLAWQDVDANGFTAPDGFSPGTSFECSDVAGPGFGLGAEVGGGVELSRALMLTGTLDASSYRLSSDPVGSCVNGIGSVTQLAFGVGLLYAFDLGPEAKLGGVDAERRSARAR